MANVSRTSHKMVLVMLLFVVGLGLFLGPHKVSAQYCGVSLPDLKSQYFQFVQVSGPKESPSQGCCKVVQGISSISCFCNYVTPALEKLISMEKAAYVGQTCGLPVKPGMKCGSYVVPFQS